MSVNYYDVKLQPGESYEGILQFDEPLKDKWGNLKYAFPDKPDGTKVSWRSTEQTHGMILALGLKKGDKLKVEKYEETNADGMKFTPFKINGFTNDDIANGKHLSSGTSAPSSSDKEQVSQPATGQGTNAILENIQVHLDSASKLLDQVQSSLSTTTKEDTTSFPQGDDDDLPF